MLSTVVLSEVQQDNPEFRNALMDAHLPTEDLGEKGQTFFKAVLRDGEIVGYCGLVRCSEDFLLRSLVIVPEKRGQGLGEAVVNAALRRLEKDSRVFLATTGAAPFFARLGFSEVLRETLPTAVLQTRQLASICPSSATIMTFIRPST